MVITVQLKLLPDTAQAVALRDTLVTCNNAANWVSERMFEHGTISRFSLQARYYKDVRAMFGLGSQATCLIFSKVADAYKSKSNTLRTFRPHGSIAFDIRNLKVLASKQQASIWTVHKRERLPFACGDFQRGILAKGLIKQSDLVLRRDGQFFLHVSVVVPDEAEQSVSDVLGVDLGIVIIAADSDGNKWLGAKLNHIRHRHRSPRRKLQSKGTKSAKRLLKKRSRKESRFIRDVNHTISKQIVSLAKRTSRAIAIEDLTGIRERIKAKQNERTKLRQWSFSQLGGFISYKAKRSGVPLVYVDPSFTSQRCSECGHIEKANRKTRNEFCCKLCGHTSCADENGAKNVRLKGLEAFGSGAFHTPIRGGTKLVPNNTSVPICNC